MTKAKTSIEPKDDAVTEDAVQLFLGLLPKSFSENRLESPIPLRRKDSNLADQKRASSVRSPNSNLPAGTSSSNKVKRVQVKNACVNCQKACKKCDNERPCLRCIKYGLQDACQDSARKERKRGFKRGPYRRGDSYSPFEEMPRRRSQSLPSWERDYISPPDLVNKSPIVANFGRRGAIQGSNFVSSPCQSNPDINMTTFANFYYPSSSAAASPSCNIPVHYPDHLARVPFTNDLIPKYNSPFNLPKQHLHSLPSSDSADQLQADPSSLAYVPLNTPEPGIQYSRHPYSLSSSNSSSNTSLDTPFRPNSSNYYSPIPLRNPFIKSENYPYRRRSSSGSAMSSLSTLSEICMSQLLASEKNGNLPTA